MYIACSVLFLINCKKCLFASSDHLKYERKKYHIIQNPLLLQFERNTKACELTSMSK